MLRNMRHQFLTLGRRTYYSGNGLFQRRHCFVDIRLFVHSDDASKKNLSIILYTATVVLATQTFTSLFDDRNMIIGLYLLDKTVQFTCRCNLKVTSARSFFFLLLLVIKHNLTKQHPLQLKEPFLLHEHSCS